MAPELIVAIVVVVAVVGSGLATVWFMRGRTKADPTPTTTLTADEVAFRIGVAGASRPDPTPSPVTQPDPGPTTVVPRVGPRALPLVGAAPVAPAPSRQRLMRDAGVALVALAFLTAAAGAILPQGPNPAPTGEVLGVTRVNSTPRASAPPDDPAPAEETPDDSVDLATPEPTPVVGVAPTSTPSPTPTAKPTPRAAPRPTPTPTPTPRRTPKPTPKVTVTPNPTSTPTPTATPIPDPVASFDCSSNGLTLSCDGSASTPGSSREWLFGDGSPASPESAHTYAAAGGYDVTLTVSNASGSDAKTQTFTVTE